VVSVFICHSEGSKTKTPNMKKFSYHSKTSEYSEIHLEQFTSVPDNKSRNIPEVVLVGRWAVGVLGIWKGWDSWVKGGANGVSLQAT
jgi:hypothetical protein